MGFYIFSIIVLGVVTVFFASEVINFNYVGDPGTAQGIFLVCMVAVCFGMWIARKEKIQQAKKIQKMKEVIFLPGILLVGFAVRIAWIFYHSVEQGSDYQLYHEIASILAGKMNGNLPVDYIALFPHVIGYPTFLAVIYSIFGNSIRVGLFFNAILNILTCWIVYKIVLDLRGTEEALFALTIITFWPSQIQYSTILGSESLFTFLLMVCVWFFYKYISDNAHTYIYCVGEGFLLAVTAFVRPMALLLVIAMGVYLLLIRQPDVKVSINLKKYFVILICYVMAGKALTAGIEYSIGLKTASSGVSYGYNLMVGLNEQSQGSYSADDMSYLFERYHYNQGIGVDAASKAHNDCLQIALKRFENMCVDGSPRILSFFVKKMVELWGNDNYGIAWNEKFSDNGRFEDNILLISNVYYLIVLILVIAAIPIYLNEKFSKEWLIILLLLATIAMHILVESQNRYHYFNLDIFAILASEGIAHIKGILNKKKDDKRCNQYYIS